MKLFLAFMFLFSFGQAFADSFELEKDGKVYLCEEKATDTSKMLRKLCKMAQKGNGETIYYPNGRVFTNHAGQIGATWLYDNGRTITNYAGQKGSSWYFSNGSTLTSYAGTIGATWYYENGRTMTDHMGQKGATWYYDNGQVMTNSGPAMTEEELMYPCEYIQ